MQCSVVRRLSLGLSLVSTLPPLQPAHYPTTPLTPPPQLFACLNRSNSILPKPPAFGSRALQHELRMRPFVDPPTCTFMTEATERRGEPYSALLASADKAFDGARQGLQRLIKGPASAGHAKERATAMLRACVMARIAARVLGEAARKAGWDGGDGDGDGDLSGVVEVEVAVPERGPWWVIPKIRVR